MKAKLILVPESVIAPDKDQYRRIKEESRRKNQEKPVQFSEMRLEEISVEVRKALSLSLETLCSRDRRVDH